MRFLRKNDKTYIKNKYKWYFNLDEGVKENLLYQNGLCGGVSIVDKRAEYFSSIENACKIEDGYVLYDKSRIVGYHLKNITKVLTMSNDTVNPFAVTIMQNGNIKHVCKYGEKYLCFDENDFAYFDAPLDATGGFYVAGRLFLVADTKIYYSSYLNPLEFSTDKGGGEFYLNKPYCKIVGFAKSENGVYILTENNVFYLEGDATGFKISTVDFKFDGIKQGSFGVAKGRLILIYNNVLYLIKRTNIAKTNMCIAKIVPNGVENQLTIDGYCAFKIKGQDKLFVTDGKDYCYVDITGYFINNNVLIKNNKSKIGDIVVNGDGVGKWTSKKFYANSVKLKTFTGVYINAKKPVKVKVITDNASRVYNVKAGETELPIFKRGKYIQVEISTPLIGQLINNVTIIYKEW